MKPYRINWIVATPNYISQNSLVFAGQTLVFNQNPNLPPDNVRPLTLSGNGTDLSGIQFTFNGQLENGLSVTETIAGPTAAATVTTANNYAKIISIIPNASSVGTVQIGVGNGGYTMPYNFDVYNKQSMISMTIENISAANTSLHLEVTADVPGNYVQGTWAPATQTWFPMITTDTSIPLADPIIAATQIQYLSWPQSAARVLVDVTSVSSFTLVTIQQGGKY